MKTEFYPRTPDQYMTMGYNEDASREQAVLDAEKFVEDKPNEMPMEAVMKNVAAGKKVKGTKGQTKEEQEMLMQKFGAYARRDKDKDPEITANNMDFSKPID